VTTTTVYDELARLEPGDLLDIGNGRSIRYLVDYDEATDINDFDCYGRTAWVMPHPWGTHKHAERPDGFDGSARILTVNGDPMWWQPPDGWHSLTVEVQRDVLRGLYDILEFGFQVVTVEMCEGRDAYGRPIVVEAQALGGVEPWTYQDRRSLVDTLAHLVAELGGVS
jgi:hypothetical protein